MNIIRNENNVVVVLDNGTILQDSNCTDALFDSLVNATNDEEVIALLNPISKEVAKEKLENTKILNDIKDSKILSQMQDSIYWEGVSTLSMPKLLVERVLEAEANGDEDALEGYKNFWTLLSLNPDAECRANLFWFLTKWGMVISKAGLFVAYRNADLVSGNSYDKVFTDHHSHTFKIRIGEMVSMPREKCDHDSDVTCSRGLVM